MIDRKIPQSSCLAGSFRLCLFQDVAQHALAVQRGGIHAQIVADGLCDGAEAEFGAEVNARFDALAADEIRHILAGVVGGLGVGGVTAVVGRDHQDVALPHPGDEVGKELVELGGGGGVARHIAAVAVEHIEINEIHKAQALEIALEVVHGLGEAVGVALRVDIVRQAAACEDIVDLADGKDVLTGGLDGVKHGLRGRLEREVVAVGRAGEAVLLVADERTGDDAADAMLSDEDLTGDAAVFIQLLQRDDVLVRRDLEHGVCGRINDEVSRAHMLRAVLCDDLGAGPGCVRQDAAARRLAEGLEHLLGEAVGIGGQRIRGNDARDLPVADRGVLAHGGLCHAGEGARLRGIRAEERQALDVAEAAVHHRGDVQLAGRGTALERVHAEITELCGISPAPQESRTIRKMRFILVFAPFCRDRNLRRERK